MVDVPVYRTKEELLMKAQSAIDHSIDEYNINKRPLSKNNKGAIGQIIEEGLFGYPVNSRAEADFRNLGIELKVAGIKELRSCKLSAKERMVLNIINYATEHNIDFENSSFWKKNNHLLMMYYLYKEKSNDFNFKIIDAFLYEFPNEDLEIIKQDWRYITKQIELGKAHLLSEGDTMYLGACTKGADAESSYRSQPFSNELARQRAFCLKNSYVTQIIRSRINGHGEKIISEQEIIHNTFEIAIKSKLANFFNKSEDELAKMLNVNTQAKNKFERYVAAMLGIKGKINDTEEFLKANMKLKTIRVQESGKIKESMSFPAFEFTKIVKESWDTSDLREMFYSSKFMFVIFQERNGKYYFDRIKIWNMPLEIIDGEVSKVWEEAKQVIDQGRIVKEIKTNGEIKTNFPGTKLNKVVHVRPHARNSRDTYPLPEQDKITRLNKYAKQCFWLNNNYIISILNLSE